jgi:hypothetical protein
MSQAFDNTGTTAVWRNEKYEAGGKAPRFKGHVYAHRDIKAGEKVAIAYWDSNSDNDKAPVLRGKVEDVYQADAGTPMQSQTPAANPLGNDEIPF